MRCKRRKDCDRVKWNRNVGSKESMRYPFVAIVRHDYVKSTWDSKKNDNNWKEWTVPHAFFFVHMKNSNSLSKKHLSDVIVVVVIKG